VSSLVSAWRWRPRDVLLHTLPLHHIHGIVNALYCPAAVGATAEFAPKFSPAGVWERLEVRGGVQLYSSSTNTMLICISVWERLEVRGGERSGGRCDAV
jgi:acyl-CoA synthetase (AMP-forming)/AMP-acid ligase II